MIPIVLLPIVASFMIGASSLEILNQWNLITFDFPPGFSSNYRSIDQPLLDIEEYKNMKITCLTETWAVKDSLVHLKTRSAGLIKKPRFRLDKSRKNSPQLALYNLLPEAVKALSLNLFKKHIKAFLLRNAFYSVLDAGTETSIDNYMRPCDPKILIFDLRNDQLVRTIILPQDVVRPASIFTNIVLDETIQGNCDAAFAYITDTIAYGRPLLENLNGDPTMYPNPDNSQFEIVGEQFSFMDGIIGLTHSPQLATVFYQPLASDRIFSVPTSVLTAGPPGEFDQLPVSLAGRKSSQGLGLAMNLNDNTLLLASDPVNLQFVADLRWKLENALYALSTRFHRFFMRSINPGEINLRLIRIPLNNNQQQQSQLPNGNSIAPWQQISATAAVNPLQQYREFYYK
nr:unnamed protein product [Callosobruchus analis]